MSDIKYTARAGQIVEVKEAAAQRNALGFQTVKITHVPYGRGGKAGCYGWRTLPVNTGFFVPGEAQGKRAAAAMVKINARAAWEKETWRFVSRAGRGEGAVAGVEVPGRWFYKVPR